MVTSVEVIRFERPGDRFLAVGLGFFHLVRRRFVLIDIDFSINRRGHFANIAYR
jgi:hypothetical protein